jgi:hypothetical protein
MAGTGEDSDERLDELLTKFPFHSERRLGPLGDTAYRYTPLPNAPLLAAIRRIVEHQSRTGHNILIHG